MFVRNKISATARIKEELESKKNVIFHFKSKILKIEGDSKVESIITLIDGQEQTLNVKAVFPYIGLLPATEFLSDKKEIQDKIGFIHTDENMETKIPGLYAVGDVRHKHIRQIITAANDGTIAAKMITNKM
jgi:thioredoxin reductase (NADPH)